MDASDAVDGSTGAIEGSSDGADVAIDAGSDVSNGKADGDGSTQRDPGDPPAECYPTCIWKLISDCRPKTECFEAETGRETVRCEPTGGWRQTVTDNGSISFIVTYDGKATCYDYVISTSGDRPIISFSDAQQNPVAQGWGQGGVFYITCLDEIVDASAPAYRFDPTQPKCAPWAPPICKPGACPP